MRTLVLETVQWSSLPDVDEVQPINDMDWQVLNEIRDVLQRHDRLERFGVCLLHRHFELDEKEIAVEYTDVERRTSTILVEPKKNSDRKLLETQWRFGMAGPEAVTKCEKQCDYNRGHKKIHVKVGR